MAGLDGFELGNMEGGMDSHGPRKLKAHSSMVDDLGDHNRPHETGSQFATFSPNQQNVGQELDLLAHLVVRNWGVTTISRLLVCSVGVEEDPRGLSSW